MPHIEGSPDKYLPGGKLRPCAATPNCVCSEYAGARCHVPPIAYSGDPAQAWARIRDMVQAMGGVILADGEGYLRAEFISRFLRFVDDLELRLDTTVQVIHVRSASRVGYSDLGVNGRRVARLRKQIAVT